MTLPLEVQINAWANGAVRGEVDDDLRGKVLGVAGRGKSIQLPAMAVPKNQWQHEEIGWGLVLPENTNISPAERATAIDAPKPIRELHEARGSAPVMRVTDDWINSGLRRYYADGSSQDRTIGGTPYGTGKGRLPLYLLIVGGPDVIPWELQYILQSYHFVGRLDLDEVGLRHYVDALLTGWSGRQPKKSHSLVWSVNHGSQDITHLMRKAVARPIHNKFANDSDPALKAGALFIDGPNATHANLVSNIAAHNPQLIVTTSHGETWPLDDPVTMRNHLGLLIDATEARLDPTLLSGLNAPSGAIWFAQACCSAGANGASSYDGVLKAGSKADRVVRAVAKCGNMTSPLPRFLLGQENPLAAFIGHVEPTFDWSIQQRETDQLLTSPLLESFHQALFTGQPVGMALEAVRNSSGTFLAVADNALRAIEAGHENALGKLFALQLVARDWQSIVLLGDPTVTAYP